MPDQRPMVAIPLAAGFEETEAMAPADALSRAGIHPLLAWLPGEHPLVPGSHGFRLRAEMCLEEVRQDAAAGIFLPGGMPGTRRLAESGVVAAAVGECRRRGRLIAAICAAPTVLYHLGLLAGRRITSHPSCRDEFTGCRYQESPVVVDPPFITSRGPGTALLCGLTIVACIMGHARAQELAGAMMVPIPDEVQEEWNRWVLTS